MDSYEDDEDGRPSRGPKHATRVPDDVAEGIHQRLAAMTARRMCNRHQCTATATTPCTHPNHRRDVDSLLSTDEEFPGVLDTLGLSSAWSTVDAAERRLWLKWIGQSGPAEDLAA